MSRANAPVILVLVTPLLLVYGFPFSWIAGPLVALAVWLLDRKAHEPAPPAPGRTHEPVPVD